MDTQTVNYLIAYFSHLLPGPEKLALKHVLHSEKIAAIDVRRSSLEKAGRIPAHWRAIG